MRYNLPPRMDVAYQKPKVFEDGTTDNHALASPAAEYQEAQRKNQSRAIDVDDRLTKGFGSRADGNPDLSAAAVVVDNDDDEVVHDSVAAS